MPETTPRLQPIVQGLMRIVFGFLWWSHGAQKLLGWFGGFGPEGGTAELTSRFGIAGVIETVGGLLITIGLFTRPVAFNASGEIATTFFWQHVPMGGFWPWDNRGEVVALYSFAFLFFAVAGAGALSVDGWLRSRKRA